MLDKTIISALLNLRKQIIRDGLTGLDHVNALLAARGIDTARLHDPQVWPVGSRGQRGIQLLVLASLRAGPKTPAQIGADFMAAKPGLARERAMIRVYRTIYKLRSKGLVVKIGLTWGLAR